MEILSVLAMLPRTDGHVEMDWSCVCVVKKRVLDAWMDLFPQYSKQSMEFAQAYADLLLRNPQADEDRAFAEWLERQSENHAKLFPINNNLFALMVTVQADLSEQ